jgi:hypothetical protein
MRLVHWWFAVRAAPRGREEDRAGRPARVVLPHLRNFGDEYDYSQLLMCGQYKKASIKHSLMKCKIPLRHIFLRSKTSLTTVPVPADRRAAPIQAAVITVTAPSS